LLQPTTVRWGKSAVYTCTIGHRDYQENVGFPILLSLEKKINCPHFDWVFR